MNKFSSCRRKISDDFHQISTSNNIYTLPITMSKPQGENIRVVFRGRPFNKKEVETSAAKVLFIEEKTGQVLLQNEKSPSDTKTFTFDHVYDENSEQVYPSRNPRWLSTTQQHATSLTQH